MPSPMRPRPLSLTPPTSRLAAYSVLRRNVHSCGYLYADAQGFIGVLEKSAGQYCDPEFS